MDQSASEPVRVRRNQKWMWPQEKQSFIQAVSLCKRLGYYDSYIGQHEKFSVTYHGRPSFLPWHRQFIRQFELQLVALDSSITLPYWDWTVDQDWPSVLWSDSFMGSNGTTSEDQVTTGPFQYYGGNGWVCRDTTRPFLRRRFGANGLTLPTAQNVRDCLQQTPYDTDPYDMTSPGFRSYLEGGTGPGIHNAVHAWVGGNMNDMFTSPNDPVFFLHHTNVDRIWAIWQEKSGNAYLPPDSAPGNLLGQRLNDLMKPWDGQDSRHQVKISDVLDHKALGYIYDTETPSAHGKSWMLPGDVLRVNEWLLSPDGTYRLHYALDGYVRLYPAQAPANELWKIPTVRRPVGTDRLVMQQDGNLVLYDTQGSSWASDTSAAADYGTRLHLTMDGHVDMFRMTRERSKRYGQALVNA
jgi:tyrosinase